MALYNRVNSNISQKEIEKLKSIYKKIFENVYELGGGYGFRYCHGARVLLYCQNILKLPRFRKEKINKKALLIAALFHDVGKIKAVDEKGELIYGNYGGVSHDFLGSQIVSEYISNYVEDSDTIEMVKKIIAEQDRQSQTIIESKIVKDMDRLDNAGLLHLWRTVTFSNYNKQNIEGLRMFWLDNGGRDHSIKGLQKYYFPEIKKIAQKRFENLDKLTFEMIAESEAKDFRIL